MNTMKMLVKREYWEHKGGIFWAPVIVGAFFTVMLLISVLVAVFGVKNGTGMHINGVLVQDLSAQMPLESKLNIAHALSMSYLYSILPLLAVLAFVVFFYSLSSLYDDRKDKSILFWKSMPVSDTQTVLSKLFTILAVTPLVPLALGLIIAIIFTLVAGLAFQSVGISVLGTTLSTSSFYLLPFEILACLPIYMLWAFPSVAWFMMVSAWAPRFPILWAVGIPVIIGVLLSISEGMSGVGIPHEWYWENIVGRLFGGFVPGVWLAFFDVTSDVGVRGSSPGGLEILQASWAILGYAKVWIATAVGCAMTYAAIRIRRYRDDG
jgi:ABC-2 type transport system permease protein